MNQPTELALSEILTNVRTVHGLLRDALPVLVTVATDLPHWPDTLLTPVIENVAESIGRLEVAAGLLVEDEEASDT